MTKSDQILLPKPDTGWFDYAFFALSDGALAILQTDSDIHGKFQAWFEKVESESRAGKMPNPWRGQARVCVIAQSGETEVLSFPLVSHPMIDRFPDGRWFLASSRAFSDEKNGAILDRDGNQSHSFHIGDGIEHIRCASDDTIWVGFFDEGVFGDTVGSGGIVRFDQNGKKLWSFNHQEHDNELFVDDCYSLTINGEEIWSCFYSDFPIIRSTGGELKHWNNSVGGAKGLAVEGTYALLAGGYPGDENRLALLELGSGQANLIGTIDRPELGQASLIQGCASTIHVISEGIWFRITVDEIQGLLS